MKLTARRQSLGSFGLGAQLLESVLFESRALPSNTVYPLSGLAQENYPR